MIIMKTFMFIKYLCECDIIICNYVTYVSYNIITIYFNFTYKEKLLSTKTKCTYILTIRTSSSDDIYIILFLIYLLGYTSIWYLVHITRLVETRKIVIVRNKNIEVRL